MRKSTLFSGSGTFSLVITRQLVYLDLEKSYYLSSGPVSVLYLCYRLITLMFHGVRYSLLYRGVYSALKNKKIGKFCSPGPLIYSFFAIFQATIIPFNCKILPLLYRKVKRKYDEEMPRALDYILAKAGVNNFPTILKKNTKKLGIMQVNIL